MVWTGMEAVRRSGLENQDGSEDEGSSADRGPSKDHGVPDWQNSRPWRALRTHLDRRPAIAPGVVRGGFRSEMGRICRSEGPQEANRCRRSGIHPSGPRSGPRLDRSWGIGTVLVPIRE